MKPFTLARSLSFVTGVAAALSVSGCGSANGDRICTDNSGRRIPDASCRSGGGRGGGGAYWHYGGRGKQTAFGERVTGGSRVASRGGFGGMARGSVGG